MSLFYSSGRIYLLLTELTKGSITILPFTHCITRGMRVQIIGSEHLSSEHWSPEHSAGLS
ncbi:conserved hypothetical protein [Vibrio crassostreae]|nr:conserved hypothetical protein [Vibrio crassostreae]CAK2909133.1 conserved hypothetical protein [Vibrio crassostreae]CAK2921601.1 conserved hypothetical protein [Vibrio crassostreae]CAK2952185.1 conserved hypothetical protein [Vibrio crassostreae]CAK3353578.1 conserved hypothetical protein [Vibrio crassostreae]